MVVGDDDQAIYGWRGADVGVILDFETDWPDVHIVKLEENYRSSQVILDAAHAVVSLNQKRREKRLFTQRAGGERIISHEAIDERRGRCTSPTPSSSCRTREGISPMTARSSIAPTRSRACWKRRCGPAVCPTPSSGRALLRPRRSQRRAGLSAPVSQPADRAGPAPRHQRPARGIGEKTVAKLEAKARLGGLPLWLAIQNAVEDEEFFGQWSAQKAARLCRSGAGAAGHRGRDVGQQAGARILLRTGYLGQFKAGEPEDESRQRRT